MVGLIVFKTNEVPLSSVNGVLVSLQTIFGDVKELLVDLLEVYTVVFELVTHGCCKRRDEVVLRVVSVTDRDQKGT